MEGGAGRGSRHEEGSREAHVCSKGLSARATKQKEYID